MSPYDEVIARACKARGWATPAAAPLTTLLYAVMSELDAERFPEDTAGACPKCGSFDTHRGHGDAAGGVETYYKECETCNNQWDQA